MRYIDLSHPIYHGMPVYPGDDAVQLVERCSLEGDGFRNKLLRIGMHTSTHIDTSRHMLATGPTVAELPLAALCGRAWLFDCRGAETITIGAGQCAHLVPGDRVLLWTSWDRHFGQAAYFERYPEIGAETAAVLIAAGVTLVGMDIPSPDRAPFPVHKALLSQGVLLVENLTGLEQLAGLGPVELLVLPLKIDADGGPARVAAQVAD